MESAASGKSFGYSASPVLIIAEDSETLTALPPLLSDDSLGVRVHVLRSRDDAEQALRAGTYRTVVSDVRLAARNNFSLLELNECTQGTTPLIVTAGPDDEHLVREALGRGSFDFLPRPIDRTQAPMTIRAALWLHQVRTTIGLRQELLSTFRRQHAGLVLDKPESVTVAHLFEDMLRRAEKTFHSCETTITAIENSLLALARTAETLEQAARARAMRRLNGMARGSLTASRGAFQRTIEALSSRPVRMDQELTDSGRPVSDAVDSESLRLIINKTPVLIYSAQPEGYIDFFNEQWLKFLGLHFDDIAGWSWVKLIHPEDRDDVLARRRSALAKGEPFISECRLRRADGEYRWMQHRHVPLLDHERKVVRWFGSSIDIDDQKRAEAALDRTADELRRSEFYLAEGQRLAHIGSWSFTADGMREYWSAEWFNMLGRDPARGVPPIPEYLNMVHPDDRERVKRVIETMIEKGVGCDEKYRIIHPERGVRWIRGVGLPVFEDGVLTRFAGTSMDITEEETLAQELKRQQGYLAEAQRLSQTGSFGWVVATGELFWSEETFRIFEFAPGTRPTIALVIERVHPEDRAFVRSVIDRATQDGRDFDIEHRLLMPDNRIKYLHVVAHRRRDDAGNPEFMGAVRDVTTAKTVERQLRQDEAELRQLINFVPQHVLVMRGDGTRLYENQAMRDYFGSTLDGVQPSDFYRNFAHPDDLAGGVLAERERAVARGLPWEGELRLRRKDGDYRWFLIRSNPLRDEEGTVIRRYATATDIEERKRAEERVQKENVVLREEIDKASMFEEIVGSSRAMKEVLGRISQVAPTDATVLITGETGTGKELIARAIHKRSPRAKKVFVSVNCAVIPQALLASELFGHERGAFTGALQRRLGRFELAEGGTIFLDEIGDLPAEMQSALLRVLQEREFERVGGTHSIRADVRVIAATNRDLQAAIMEKTFRSDLFYRLQVFPIEIRPLRERKEDITLLVEYFIERYASKMGKLIRSVNKQSLNLLQSYFWPGNVRELQNVIERAVIVANSDVLTIDECWLSGQLTPVAESTGKVSKLSAVKEKHIIEAALAECRGRVSGPSGAATKLGVPSTTLESKIRSLKINKHRFKALD